MMVVDASMPSTGTLGTADGTMMPASLLSRHAGDRRWHHDARESLVYPILPHNWDYLFCLTVGSILCATDPVAVVALLKDLGASPTLTVQIQGEALLNDGTAIVLFRISYNMFKDIIYEPSDVIIELVWAGMCAIALGVAIGYIFFVWIRMAGNKFAHHSSMVQAMLTLCCAYWTFIIGEGVLRMSGVLATVAASLVLAHQMWPVLVSKTSMHAVWHMIEYLGNTLIFFLAGALMGNVMAVVDWLDYVHLVVIYIVLLVIRFALLIACRPVLKYLSEDKQDVSVAEILVITWGGLRGAVGLALAMQVYLDRGGKLANGDYRISEQDANRILFYVGGIAALTLFVNASSSPALVQWLGITQMPETDSSLHSRPAHLRCLAADHSEPPWQRAREFMWCDCTWQTLGIDILSS